MPLPYISPIYLPYISPISPLYISPICQALVPLPSFNPFVLRIEGRHGARAQAEAPEGDFAAQVRLG